MEAKPETQVEQKPSTQPPQKKEESKELPEPTFEDFSKLDIRVGKIVECWKHPESVKLYCEKIDIGGEIREIASGLQEFVPQDEMTSDLVLVLVNLKPRKLAGFHSNGMVLCASNDTHTAVELLRPAAGSKIGERATVEGYDKITQDKEKVIDPKKKVLETVMPALKTDDSLEATFLGKKLLTSAGTIKAKSLKNAHIS